MNRRILVTFALVLPAALIAFAIGRKRTTVEKPGVYWPVPEFTLLDQDSAVFGSNQLKGHVWLASFVYTNCPDVCPLVTQRMAALRDSLRDEKLLGDVRLLSLTVDPLRDTPGVLRAHAQQFNAAKPEWVFLTGSIDIVIPLVNEGFHLTALHPGRHDEHEFEHNHDDIAGSDYMVSHSDRIVLIDREGQVRGTYPSSEPEALARLRRDLAAVR